MSERQAMILKMNSKNEKANPKAGFYLIIG